MAQTRSGHKPDDRLVIHIIIALLAGVGLALLSPDSARAVAVLGTLFVKALKAVAPLLVLVLVAAVIANKKPGVSGNMRPVMLLYLCGTLLAAIVGVVASTLFPSRLVLSGSADSTSAPSGIAEVLQTLLLKVVDNPVHALANGNFIGILAWAVAIGLVLQPTTGHSKQLLQEMAQAVSHIVKQLIRLAPLGIFGLVADNVASNGLGVLLDYSRLLLVLLGAMLFVALLVNPLLVYLTIRRNPYPLVFTCLRDSGVTAFFTRSSAANIPVNMRLCQRLGLDEDSYAVSIPLGATINMAGAAITISVLSLATVHTLGISVDIPTAILLCVVSSVAACGASGIAGGSLLLIPLACSLFGISTEVAMQVVAIGMMIGVVQDAAETALNSSTDVLFTAAAAMRRG